MFHSSSLWSPTPRAPRGLAAFLALASSLGVVALLGLLACPLPRLSAGQVVVNEIHFDPPDNTRREEFIELFNVGGTEADLSAWFFSSGIGYRFPEGTRIPPGGYLVVAEDPGALQSAFGIVGALGPWEGRLESDGETIALRNPSGALEDEVDYRVGFPWPVASAGEGSSMELVHPLLDNDLGGSWLSSGLRDGPPIERVYFVPAEAPDWHYRKGTSEASVPSSAWREPGFSEDESWLVGQTTIGYADDEAKTVLPDMLNGYGTVYLRRAFAVDPEGAIPARLKLSFRADDGLIAWVNGVEVARVRVPQGEQAFDGRATTSVEPRWESVELPPTSGYLRAGENLLAVHAFNVTRSSTDFSIDVALFEPGDEDVEPGTFGPPTPGAVNSVFAENAPPQVRQVECLPESPAAGTPIAIRAKVTDPERVAWVRVAYQVVLPGAYVPARLPLPLAQLLSTPTAERPENPAFEDPASWTTLEMRDDGTGGDAASGDALFTAVLPAQTNRTLVRYRILAADTLGSEVRVPRRDDPSLNFACFVHDGVPAWKTTRLTIRPEGVGYEYPAGVMDSLPVYTLITRAADLTQAIAAEVSLQIPQGNEARFAENWEGAFVYRGVVHDHVVYRLRGANGRYQIPPTNPSNVAGKRHWHFKFQKGRYLQALDKWGRPYPTPWRVLNTDRLFGNRLDGNWGLGDMVNDIIWNANSVPAPFGHYFHWRVVQGASEAPAGVDGQYLGDFYGVARAFENYDVRFLEAHELPKGNLYKLVNQTNDPLAQERYQAPDAVSDGSDHDNIENQLRPTQPDSWLDAYVDYEEWNRYHAVAQAIRHYDYWPEANKNATWYFTPEYAAANRYFGRMQTFPFDADATWGPTWNDGRDRPYEAIFGGAGKPVYQIAYRNAVREVRDLLWQADELERVIRQTAAFLRPLADADTDRWRNAPAAAGRQYFAAAAQATPEGKAADMIRFAFQGGSWDGGSVGAGGRAAFLDSLADGPHRSQLPQTPTASYLGPPGYPADGLLFGTSAFSDPQGSGTFLAMEWRLARASEIDDPETVPVSDPVWKLEPVKLELAAEWRSGILYRFESERRIPASAIEVGKRYRVRVRMLDATGLWSHWSLPVEFTAGPPQVLPLEFDSLRITELMYHPIGDKGFEFIEIANVGADTVSLEEVSLAGGIRFRFAEGSVGSLAPGEYLVVAADLEVFEARYGTSGILLAGEFEGSLSDAGDTVDLAWGKGGLIQRITYADDWWKSTDGQGYSLVILDPSGPLEAWDTAEGWRASRDLLGSPGRAEPAAEGGLRRVGDMTADGILNISDPIALLRFLFLGDGPGLPCGSGDVLDPANLALLDANGDTALDLTDAIYVLNFLFLGGNDPVGGKDCIPIVGCTEACLP